MTWWSKLIDFLFYGLVHRHRQQTRAMAALALSTWKRHHEGDLPEGEEAMREAAEFLLTEDLRTGNENWSTDIARDVLKKLED